ncbi:MAG: GEVED domain-containing protein, partial [Ferruginibacter sp.]
LTINNNNTSTVKLKAGSGNVSNTDDAPLANGTINIDIAGPVTSFTLLVTGTGTDALEDGSYFISDISACSAGTFPLNYYAVAKPYAGQPSYFLAVRDNYIYYVNVANGVARLLFRDNLHTNINSLAYDPYRHMCYYSFSLTGASQSDKLIRRYDYDMDTIGDFIPNVNTLGIPTFESGVESGAAAFYNNCYYLGIEGTNQGDDKTNRESIVWRIDFTPTYGPASIAQVYAVPSDDGNGTGTHDWGDIGINDGILYDFDGASGQTDFYHKNLLTGNVVRYSPNPTSLIPRQVSVDWTGQMYNSGSPSSIASGTVAPYNGNGTINTSQQYTMKYQGVAVTGSWGDAGEAFKPKTDFGDAPASYDPPAFDPGTHERNDSIYLGPIKPGIEWNKKTSADATGDGAEEDGIAGVIVITTGVSNFTVPVKVMNRTTRPATLVGWVDANGNGTFEASEGVSVVVPASASMQTITLLWSGINTTLPAYSTTFMRIRIATNDQLLTTAKMNGYMDNGEIEDYVVSVSLLLPDQNVSLKAQKLSSDKVSLVWSLNQENNNASYELQSSDDGSSWQTLTYRPTVGGASPATYNYLDGEPNLPLCYYRVRVTKNSGAIEFSETKKVDFKKETLISLSPNPARNKAVLKIETAVAGKGHISILDYTARSMYEANIKLINGTNEIDLPIVKKLSNGMYKVSVKINDDEFVTTLVVVK